MVVLERFLVGVVDMVDAVLVEWKLVGLLR